MPKFIEARSKKTGRTQIIPERWLSIDKPPFNDFTTEPADQDGTAEVDPAEQPVEDRPADKPGDKPTAAKADTKKGAK
ncbi:hypothetical protein [Arthrobacter sp. JSM 101049]|uniref:hypothetical protein n=1 Tax=Arthrobacter sp. JSM 101049 TaxID=929097 RepID=UPI0035637B3D